MTIDHADDFVDRSRAAAHDAIHEASERLASNVRDDRVSEVLSKEFIDEVFQLAWRHQFEDDRQAVARELRELFGDRVTEVFAGEVKQ